MNVTVIGRVGRINCDDHPLLKAISDLLVLVSWIFAMVPTPKVNFENFEYK